MNFKSQSGRSMTEMLGTLAIVGILSIGAIAGYSYAMDKYRANETINDINLRTTDLINQLSRGQVPNFGEWEDENTIYPISVERNNSLGEYAIIVENVPARVCKMIGDTLKDDMTIYIGSEELTDNTDETRDPCDESDNNVMEFFLNTVSCDPACGENEYCESGFCFKMGKPDMQVKLNRTCTTNEECGPCGTCNTSSSQCNVVMEGKQCTTENGADGQCYWGECLEKSGCIDNSECDPGYYCASTNTSQTERFAKGESGTCVKADFRRYEINNNIYYIYNTSISWWDAMAACEAIGKEMVRVEDFIIGWDGKTASSEIYYTMTDDYKEIRKIWSSMYWVQEAVPAGEPWFSYVFDIMDSRVWRDRKNIRASYVSMIGVCH
ncbi:MAG: hypothetical protein IKV03_06615 [Alphaproteobacteria bacterium]|nr:hypothetical protein [Alphaproteobacteria bacterium]